MDDIGPQNLLTNMVMRRPVMDAAIGGSTQMLPPAPRSCQSDSLLDDKKTGATLLFTGVFLALVGVIFTTTGWRRYLANPTFEWTQLLGPILISVGGTFMLTSVCKFGISFCWPCRRLDEGVNVIPAMDSTSIGRPFTLSGINQPIMLQGATMLCIPPVYNCRNQEVCQVIEFQAGRSVNSAHADDPPPDYECCVDNATLTDAEGASAHSTETEHKRSR